MKKILKRFMACMIIITMMSCSSLVYAKEEEQQVTEKSLQETEEPTVGEKSSQEMQQNVSPALNYIYLASEYIQTPDEQLIVISWGDENNIADDMILTCEDENGQIIEIPSTKANENMFLFSKTFLQEEKGIYQGKKITITQGENIQEFALNDLGIQMFFGVDQNYEGDEKSQHIEMEQFAVDDANESGVATVSSDLEEGAKNIGEVLSEAVTEQLQKNRSGSGQRNSEVVIVLDPGHDVTKHAGARGNGVEEEKATLAITKYCKAALEKYANVKVYMTRETDVCPFPRSTSNIDDIVKRVEWAKTKGADVFVSFHLNSSTSSSPNGAEVYYPEGDAGGKNLSDKILQQLNAIGLYNRGSKGDAGYAVIRNAVANGFPGLIIEHAFLSNASDASNYLKSEAGLKKLGEADAKGIASFYNLSTSNNYWKESNGNKYYYLDGVMVRGEHYIDGAWYYFDNTGAMQKGMQQISGKTVYYGDNGKMVFGEAAIDGKWYCFSNKDGSMLTGFQKVDGRTVYYGADGIMRFGKQTINGKIYYFSTSNGEQYIGFADNGSGGRIYYLQQGGLAAGEIYLEGYWRYFDPSTNVLKTGFWDLGSKRVYYNAKGEMAFGEHYINNKWYNFSLSDGSMLKGFHTVGKKVVYYNGDGQMVFGKQVINGKEYFFSLSDGGQHVGLFTISPKEKVFYLSEGGKATGERSIEGKWYYFDPVTYLMQIGLKQLGNKTVYYDGDGRMVFGQQVVNGKDYYFSISDGGMQSGFVTIGDKVMYYNPEGGRAAGEKYIDGYWYYFDPGTYIRTSGFKKIGEKTVLYSNDGKMLFGEQYVNGSWYYMSPGNGSMTIGFYNFSGKMVYYNSKGQMLFGPQKIDNKTYYFSLQDGAMLYNIIEDGVFYGRDGVAQKAETVMGKSDTTPKQMQAFFESKAKYPTFYQTSDAPTLEKFCEIFYEESVKQGVKAEVVFVQSMLETGWLKFEGAVKKEQFNFAGIGAVDGGAQGASFPSVRIGVRAQIQHLQAYASTDGSKGLVDVCVDPRYHLVKPKGGAEYVQYLGRQENPLGNYGWASGASYGLKIMNLVQQMKKY